jgi:hypothetical protein
VVLENARSQRKAALNELNNEGAGSSDFHFWLAIHEYNERLVYVAMARLKGRGDREWYYSQINEAATRYYKYSMLAAQ